MTRPEIKKLMRTRRAEPYAEKRIRATLRMIGREQGAFTPQDVETVRVLLNELKMRRDVAKEKSLSLKAQNNTPRGAGVGTSIFKKSPPEHARG